VKGTSVNGLIIESLTAETERVRADKDFTRAKKLLERDSSSNASPSDAVPDGGRLPLEPYQRRFAWSDQ
jgi:hypothetical protein